MSTPPKGSYIRNPLTPRPSVTSSTTEMRTISSSSSEEDLENRSNHPLFKIYTRLKNIDLNDTNKDMNEDIEYVKGISSKIDTYSEDNARIIKQAILKNLKNFSHTSPQDSRLITSFRHTIVHKKAPACLLDHLFLLLGRHRPSLFSVFNSQLTNSLQEYVEYVCVQKMKESEFSKLKSYPEKLWPKLVNQVMYNIDTLPGTETSHQTSLRTEITEICQQIAYSQDGTPLFRARVQ